MYKLFFMNRKINLFLTISVFLASFLTSSAQENKIFLNSSSPIVNWKVQPQADNGSAYKEQSAWVKAIVPGTVFGSYVEAGLEKDPNFADNAYNVDKSKYDRNFWYKTEIKTTSLPKGQRLWLNFEGINRKGDIYFNDQRLGSLDGFMERGKFEITNLVKPNGTNILSVLVYWPTNPIPNYASPTYISSASWDWMPYVPGLLSGITDDVYLTTSGDVSIVDPWIRTSVPSNDQAKLSIQVELKNNSTIEQKGLLKGVINPGNIVFSQTVKIPAGKQRTIGFNPSWFKELNIQNPKLWWPNGYGEQNLYTCDFTYLNNDTVSDSKKVTFGIKQYSYDTLQTGDLQIKINGQPIYIKGGNWGMSEYMLRCRGEEYDLKVRLHKEMNYNMIRNWIGSTTDDEFYEACDKYGILVWDDFWLNSHRNLPDDVFAFNKNAVEKIKRLRNHPSIAVWCGDNEGYPEPPLNGWLAEDVKVFDGGDRRYHANSHSDGLSGSGPWTNSHPNWYFSKYPGGYGDNIEKGWGFRTEIGTAVFTTFESFKKFMPKESWWPRNEMWDKHFFGPSAGNASPDKYFKTVNQNYGEATGIEDFCRKAQLVNIEVNKAMYEGWQHHIWNDATGIMTWMSQSAYPSLVWQTYDYYYDLNGAYWGVKKACEPVHIQWSYADNTVKVVNATLNKLSDLKAEATVYNMDGQEVTNFKMKETVNVQANDAALAFTMNFKTDNLAYSTKAVASSVHKDGGETATVTDGSDGTRWASNYTDDEWIYVDLGESKPINEIVLNWESANAKSYKLQVSDDQITWKEIYLTENSKGGVEDIKIDPITARYVKMLGIKKSSQWGYSLYEFEVYGPAKIKTDLSAVHFIRLNLKDKSGKLLSDNFYWRSNKISDYQALNSLPKAKLSVKSSISTKGKKSVITAKITNVGSSVAFAVHVQAIRKSDGERILPAISNDDYFTLLQKESKNIEIEFNTDILKNGAYELVVTPYNNK